MSFKIHLIPDDYHLPHVGRLADGGFFWIDGQLTWGRGATRDFICTYLFDQDGRLARHNIEDLGCRNEENRKDVRQIIDKHLAALGPYETADIWVEPFSVSAHGESFGLVTRVADTPKEAEDLERIGPLVDAMPGLTLMFYPPWDEGAYDT